MIPSSLRPVPPTPEGQVRLLVLRPAQLGTAYERALADAGFALTLVQSTGAAVRSLVADRPDAVLALTGVAGAADLCEVLRALGPQPLVVAAPALPADVAIACLDQGADAAITLPVDPAEIVARLRSVWRRTEHDTSPAAAQLTLGDVRIDLGAHAVFLRGEPLDLSPTEFAVLALLVEKAGQIVTNRELLTRIWGEAYADDLHYVRLYIGYLRAKLEDDPRHPRRILTQWGVGYRLAAERTEIEC